MEPDSSFIFMLFTVMCLMCDAVRLIREEGFRPNSYYYHLGDGSHAYHYNLETASSIYFKCVMYDKLKCSGRAILRLGGGFRHSKPHNHPPDPDFVGERHFRANVLQHCREGQFVAFQDILDDARRDARYSRRVRSNMTMRRLRNSMYKARMNSYPQPGPQTLTELTQLLIQRRWQKISRTVDGDDNLYAGSITAIDGSHHVAFISRRMRDFTARINILQSDGTFRARPNVPPSSQVFVLVTPWRSTVIPIGWILMERRTLAAYRAVFHLIKHVCPNLDPGVIVTDWEYPQQHAWQEAFPNAEVQGCLWHLCRAFVKKANKLRLLRFRVALPALLTYLRKACAISLLPARFFRTGIRLLRTAAREEDILLAFLLVPFFQYVEDKWINNINRRRYMTMFESVHRTNNCCESHNRMLRRAVGPYRPNVYAFIAALARLEHNAMLDVDLMNRGGPAKRRRRWQSVYVDDALKALCNDLRMDVFRDRDVSVRNFINHASELFVTAYSEVVRREVGGN